MRFFERHLTLWVFPRIVTGIVAGQEAPTLCQAIGRTQIAR